MATYTWHNPETLNAAFKALRKARLVARQNFTCCSSCAGYELAEGLGAKVRAGKLDPSAVAGAVFYTRQDAASRDRGLPFYLAFGPVEVCARNGNAALTLGGTAEEVGALVCDVLHRAGVPFEWNGEGSTKIKILPTEVR